MKILAALLLVLASAMPAFAFTEESRELVSGTSVTVTVDEARHIVTGITLVGRVTITFGNRTFSQASGTQTIDLSPFSITTTNSAKYGQAFAVTIILGP